MAFRFWPALLVGFATLTVMKSAASPETPKQVQTSSVDQAVAWLRANNAFGPGHRTVDILSRALNQVDEHKAFFLWLGTGLVKSHQPTLLAGRHGGFQAFEIPGEQAGKWIPERLTELKSTADLGDRFPPAPLVTLEHLKWDHAAGLDPRRKLAGSIRYRKQGPLQGVLGLRLIYMADDYTYTRTWRLDDAPRGENGILTFAFAPLQVQGRRLAGSVPIFLELCSFPERGKAIVSSNSVPALLHFVENSP